MIKASSQALFVSATSLFWLHCGDDAPSSRADVTGGTATSAGASSLSGQSGAATANGGAAAGTAGQGNAAGAGAPPVGGVGAGGHGGASGASLGGSAGASGMAGGDSSANGGGGASTFAITSAEHRDAEPFADALTCAGEGRSPALSWSAGPAGTKSYAITFFDETLVEKNDANGYHWVIWDIPADTRALPASLPAGGMLTTPVAARQSSPANPFDGFPANAYFGPCPNAVGNGSVTDRYAFTLYALPVEELSGMLNGVRNVAAAIKAASPLAEARLTGTSNAKPN